MARFTTQYEHYIIVNHTLSRQDAMTRFSMAEHSQYTDHINFKLPKFTQPIRMTVFYDSHNIEAHLSESDWPRYANLETVFKSMLNDAFVKCDWYIRLNGSFQQDIDLDDLSKHAPDKFSYHCHAGWEWDAKALSKSVFKNKFSTWPFRLHKRGQFCMTAIIMESLLDVHAVIKFVSLHCNIIVSYLNSRSYGKGCQKVVSVLK